MNLLKILSEPATAFDIIAQMDARNLPFEAIKQVNWPQTYPYQPEVRFRMAYTATALLLHYRVKEQAVLAQCLNDNEAIWTDSCVEFFCQPDEDGWYYNLECNCIGSLLLGCGPDRHHRERADAKILKEIQRWSSLGHFAIDKKEDSQEIEKDPENASLQREYPKGGFPKTEENKSWEIAIILPFHCFFKHHIQSMDGKIIRGNFYKCGDHLAVPHYLSWQPILTEKPDFHRPEFFGDISLSK